MKTTVLTRGLVNYFDESGKFHKCFAVSNGETFVFWFGGIYISNPFIKAEFQESDEVSLHHYSIVQPESKTFYELMEKHFELCVTLSQMEWPHEFSTVGFENSQHMSDIPQIGDEFERMHIFHHNQDELHAVFGDPLDGGFGFINLMIGAIEEAFAEFFEDELKAENEELQIEEELESYKGLSEVNGAVLKMMGFSIPECSDEVHIFHEFDGGISQLLQDQYGNIHIFNRHGNDWFGYGEPLSVWLSQNAERLIEQQQEYTMKANAYQKIIQEILLSK